LLVVWVVSRVEVECHECSTAFDCLIENVTLRSGWGM
jgi:hypothetical protein